MDKDPTNIIRRIFDKKGIPDEIKDQSAEKSTSAEIKELPAEELASAKIELATKAIYETLEAPENLKASNKIEIIGDAYLATSHLEDFSEEEHRQIAKLLIEGEYYHQISMKMDEFTGVNQKAYAEFLINIGKGDLVASDLYKFYELNNKEMIIRLIDLGYSLELARDIYKLNELDKEVAIKFINSGCISWFKNNIEHFTGLDSEVALLLIENNESECFSKNIKLFSGLSNQVIEALLDADIDFGIEKNLKYFSGLSIKSARSLLKHDLADVVAYNPGSFDVKHSVIAKMCIKKNFSSTVAKNINLYDSSDHIEIAKTLLENNEMHWLKKYIDNFSTLDEEIGMTFINTYLYDFVLERLDKFPGLSFNKIQKCIEDSAEIDKFADKMGIKTGSEIADNSNLAYYSEKMLVKENESKLINSSGALDYEKVFESLINGSSNPWKDNLNVQTPMKRGAEIFGYEKMFSYINRIDVSRHDQLFFFGSVIKLFDRFKEMHSSDEGMTKEKLANLFFSNILQQVKMDNSVESSYNSLNTISANIDGSSTRFERYRDQMAKLKNAGFTHEMEKFETLLDGGCFESWKNLQTFSELVEMLDRAKIWEKLAILKQKANSSDRAAAMYEYVSKIMFHKDSSVNISAAEEFFMDPDRFLNRSDIHAPSKIHERKKPSNYFDIPNLDLTGQELVEALAVGGIDKVQAFTGMEVTYIVGDLDNEVIPSEQNENLEEMNLSITDRIKLEVGSRKEGNANPKLFGELSKLLKSYHIKLNPLDFNELQQSLSSEISGKIEDLLIVYPNQINLDRSKIGNTTQGNRYRVKIYDKHDPKAALAGDDTNCCMPFGSGKNNVYTFNPNCGLVTVEAVKPDGNYMTIAQSVITLDQDIRSNVGNLMKDSENINTDDILSNIDIIGGNNYIACDNIEIRTNYNNEKYRKTIAKLYQDFFGRYAKVFNQNNLTGRTVSLDKIIVGQGCSDYHFGNQEDNTYVPLAPVSYSDKLGTEVDVIRLTSKDSIPGIVAIDEHITTSEKFEYNEDLPASIKPLTYQDALIVANLESKAYNQKSLVGGLSAMENSLIAKDINNADKNRPNMAFKYGNKGYILAYEGKISSLGDEKAIYVADFAVDPNCQLAGGSLMITFMDQYKKEYVEKGNLIPIYGHMRESTSYKLVMDNIARFEKRLGIKLQLEELGTFNYGNETMHKVIIRPVV